MARRRAVVRRTAGVPVMPRHLLELSGLMAESYRQALRAKCEWFQANGINPGDWPAVYAVLKSSHEAHGLELSSDRARRRLLVGSSPNQKGGL